ncbi:MAG: hypothetical protein ACYDB8_12660 [Acidiferrobacterales bacterium]
MDDFRGLHDEIIQEHAALIHLTVGACTDARQSAALEGVLLQAESNGWHGLVQAIRRILDGKRNPADLGELDDEDREIVITILRCLEDQSSLPDLAGTIAPRQAAIQISTLVLAARGGNRQAVESLEMMAAQMAAAGGDLAQIAAVIGNVVDGERRLEKLTFNMGQTGTRIVQDVLEELEKREPRNDI